MSYWENKNGPMMYADKVTPVPKVGDRCSAPVPGGGHTCKMHDGHNGPHECVCGIEAINEPVTA